MSVDAVSQYLSQIGRKGGKARLRTMTPEQRRAVALKASKAAAAARTKRAKRKKSKGE
jgi:conjugal transfer/entry exclusion protein